jgi:hypothetical protein
MAKSPKYSKSKLKPTSTIERIMDKNRDRNQALKKLLKFIEGDETNNKTTREFPKHNSDKSST